MNRPYLIPIYLSFVLLTSCSTRNTPADSGEHRGGKGVLRLATTTSTRDSGLLDKLIPVFGSTQNCRVDVIAVGTGAALKLGAAGDADVVIVHARAAEQTFMDEGHGVRHEEFMYNDFVLLGPASDPGQIRNKAPIEALGRIAAGQHRFTSRGDDSGTHKRELTLWKQAGGRPAWDEYIECGQGMGPTLIMADEKQTYVLADMGTYLNFKDKIDLVPLAASDECLHNPYAAMVVNPNKNDLMQSRLAHQFVDFLISEDAQKRIAEHRLADQQLFYPTRLSSDN